MLSNSAIFFDLDGTIWNNQNQTISSELVRQLNQMKQTGFSIFVCTGRTFATIPYEIKEKINWNGFICDNGTLIYDENGEKLFFKGYTNKIYQEIMEIAARNDLCVEVKTWADRFIIGKLDDHVKKAHRYFGLEIPSIVDADTFGIDDITTFMVYGEEKDVKEFEEIDGVQVLKGESSFADIIMENTSKFTGIEFVMKKYSLSKSITFGDSLNDLEMIKNSSFGIAMGNSNSEVKKVADFITKDVSEDGVLYALKRLPDIYYNPDQI